MTEKAQEATETKEYSFKKQKLVGFVDIGDEFWEGLEDGILQLSRCAQCKRWIWEPNFRCGACGAWELEWVEVDPVGTIYGWTRANQVFPRVAEFADLVPYVNLQVQVAGDDGPVLPGLLEGTEEGLRVGAAVTGRINPPSERSRGYAFLTWALTRP